METSIPWQQALKMLRPGSRTVVFAPPGFDPVVELARRGFRILLVHSDPDFCSACRATLRELGLSSQMMGSHRLVAGTPLKLAHGFYDLFLTFSKEQPSQTEAQSCLAPQGKMLRVRP